MKKYVISLVLTISAIMLVASFPKNQQIEPVNIELGEEIPIIKPEILYIARILDGNVAIYVPGSDAPYIVTDINVKTLPSADQESLLEGIIIDENYTLAKFLEDFGS